MDPTINNFPVQYVPSGTIEQDDELASTSFINHPIIQISPSDRSVSQNSKKVTRVTRPRPVQVHKPSTTDQTSKVEGETITLDTTFEGLDEICSYCNIGTVEKNFSLPGVVLCLVCFPVGFVWLFCFMEKQCSHCGKMYL